MEDCPITPNTGNRFIPPTTHLLPQLHMNIQWCTSNTPPNHLFPHDPQSTFNRKKVRHLKDGWQVQLKFLKVILVLLLSWCFILPLLFYFLCIAATFPELIVRYLMEIGAVWPPQSVLCCILLNRRIWDESVTFSTFNKLDTPSPVFFTNGGTILLFCTCLYSLRVRVCSHVHMPIYLPLSAMSLTR